MNEITVHSIEISGPADGDFLSIVGDFIVSLFRRLESLQRTERLAYQVQLAVHETCTNIVDHAYGMESNGRIRLKFSLRQNPLQIIIDVKDSGRSFEPQNVAEPDSENLQVRGYGLYLIKQLMDQIIYTPSEAGNHWRLIKDLGTY